MIARLLTASGTDKMVAWHGVTHCPQCDLFIAGGNRKYRTTTLTNHTNQEHAT